MRGRGEQRGYLMEGRMRDDFYIHVEMQVVRSTSTE